MRVAHREHFFSKGLVIQVSMLEKCWMQALAVAELTYLLQGSLSLLRSLREFFTQQCVGSILISDLALQSLGGLLHVAHFTRFALQCTLSCSELALKVCSARTAGLQLQFVCLR